MDRGTEQGNLKNIVGRLIDQDLLGVAFSVEAQTGVRVELFLSRLRYPNIKSARDRFFFALRQRGLSLPEIGRLTGRDHTTVLHAIRRVAA